MTVDSANSEAASGRTTGLVRPISVHLTEESGLAEKLTVRLGDMTCAWAHPYDLHLTSDFLAADHSNDLSSVLRESSHVLMALGLLVVIVAGVAYPRITRTNQKEKPLEWEGSYYEI